MILGYELNMWLDLLQYVIEVFIIFCFICVISCILTNKMLHNDSDDVIPYKNKKVSKKKCFIDVA